ncbi:hypothetical protein AD928_03380 [Acetobacter cerevisiae]|uniref:Uncharacterized protein n=1 Tax=Acetobacter cerevisiae TaxID=178900 RepID=A0A149QKH0_9PROT|nr:hypothetical protein AD928_03380 [Acetobacter cerevisiae]
MVHVITTMMRTSTALFMKRGQISVEWTNNIECIMQTNTAGKDLLMQILLFAGYCKIPHLSQLGGNWMEMVV